MEHVEIAICGTGFAGLGAAIRLRQEGYRDFVVLERASEVGGTWRENTYPGCACDVESHLYSFSFAPNPRWSRAFSPQEEILAYLKRCAEEFGVMPHIRFDHAVEEARWDNDTLRWHIRTSRGVFSAKVFIAAMGALNEPSIPALPGLASFQGQAFHSARWPRDLSLTGRKVAVVGTGASAIQIVPAIQPHVEKLTLFQRTPAWVLPRFDRAISQLEQELFARVPFTQKLVRAAICARREAYVVLFRRPELMKLIERLALRYLEREVPDPVLRQKLTPDFRMGCKRILVSNDYLRSLTQANVSVVTSPIREVRPHAVVTRDGMEHPADVLVFGTGFQVTEPPFARKVVGKDGRTLHETWEGSPKAHLGTTVVGFPNLFVLLGPNTGLGHTSVVLMIESQLELVLAALKHMQARKLRALEPRADAQARFLAEIEERSQDTVWTVGGCKSWYFDATGKNSTLWPSFTFRFKHKARFRPHEYWARV